MRATKALFRQPLIKFLGKRSYPSGADHTPKPHPCSPDGTLPHDVPVASSSGSGPVISELPRRFRYHDFFDNEIENINSGGAEVIF